MEVNAELLEKHLRKTSIVSNVISITIALVTALSVGYGFYYSTRTTLENHTSDIMEVKGTVKEIQKKVIEIDIYKGVSGVEIVALKEKVDKMDTKLDKIIFQTK